MNDVRVAVVGGGLAGSLLAWRLATTRLGAGRRIDVFTGGRGPDATEASGGLVRGFEEDPAAADLATASLAELTASVTLTRWAQYRQIGSVYIRHHPDGLESRAARINAVLPESADVRPADRLGGGWAGFPDGAYAIVERTAGYIEPDALRRAVLAELPRLGVRLVDTTVTGVEPGDVHRLRWAGGTAAYDVVVLATGARTGDRLTAAGLPAAGLRTKLVQYGLYHADGPRPPAFVDDTSGLYGRAGADGLVLLGVPSDAWDPPLDPVRPKPTLQWRAERLAAERLPRLRLGPAVQVRASVDCYGPPGHLALRAVPGSRGLHTFTAGSGGSAKLALAASATAAAELTASVSTTGVHT